MVPPAEPSARHPAVLLAEHEPEVAELARRYLARAGLRVIMAATPQETIAALCERPAAPAVAVLDLTMRGLDARRLRRLLAPRETPAAAAPVPAIYLLGGSMRPRDVRASADRCLYRPFSPRLLVAGVLSVLPPPLPAPATSRHDRRGFPADRAENPRRSLGSGPPAIPSAVPAPEPPPAPGPGLAPEPPPARAWPWIRNRRRPRAWPWIRSPAGSGPAAGTSRSPRPSSPCCPPSPHTPAGC